MAACVASLRNAGERKTMRKRNSYSWYAARLGESCVERSSIIISERAPDRARETKPLMARSRSSLYATMMIGS